LSPIVDARPSLSMAPTISAASSIESRREQDRAWPCVGLCIRRSRDRSLRDHRLGDREVAAEVISTIARSPGTS
jgi:hypothetical protein